MKKLFLTFFCWLLFVLLNEENDNKTKRKKCKPKKNTTKENKTVQRDWALFLLKHLLFSLFTYKLFSLVTCLVLYLLFFLFFCYILLSCHSRFFGFSCYLFLSFSPLLLHLRCTFFPFATNVSDLFSLTLSFLLLLHFHCLCTTYFSFFTFFLFHNDLCYVSWY